MRKLNVWQRNGIAISVVWLAATSYLYFSAPGEPIDFCNELGWVRSWRLVPTMGGWASFFEIEPHYFKAGFNLSGFLSLVLMPVAFLWAIGYAVAWTRRLFTGQG